MSHQLTLPGILTEVCAAEMHLECAHCGFVETCMDCGEVHGPAEVDLCDTCYDEWADSLTYGGEL